jgi:tetratricopeptide (TPR) repeat protein
MTIRPLVRRVLCAALALACAAAAACSKSPEELVKQYEASGDAYVARRQFKEAVIEYRNALKASPARADIHHKLGRAYEESGDPVSAYAEFARAADIDPSNLDAQMRAGTLLLVAREFEAARMRAELAIKADPSHVPAHILLGNTLAGLNETAGALRQIEQAIDLDPSYAPAWTALGAVTFAGGRKAEAAAAFQKAVDLAPDSVDARLALANYQWASGAIPEAETTLKAALRLDPANVSAHRALALLYVTTRRAPEAEAHFRTLATDTEGRLALADYYMGLGRNSDALSILKEIEESGDRNDARAARLRTASIQYATGNKAEAHRIVDALIEERPRYEEARTAKARMLLSDGGSAAEAAAHAREAVKADENSVGAHYALGLAALALRNVAEAERAFQTAARLSPRAAAAQMQLARIRMAQGDTGAAVSAAEAASRERPGDPEAAVLLAQTLRAQGNVERARRELQKRIAEDPRSAPLRIEMGWLALHRQDPAAARQAFGEALRIDPQSLEARHGLVAVDVSEKKMDAARARVAEWQKASLGDIRLQVLAGRVEIAAGNFAAAEPILAKVIAADASQLDAYELLGRAYVGQGKVDQAVKQYEALAERSPGAATGARTMVGMLHETRNDRPAAMAAYEKVLALDPKAGVAANNLAWLYVADGKLDDALRLARVAQDSLRRRPEPEDTLGWVYLQKGLATQAIAAFERALSRAPQNPVYHYHQGLAYLKSGNADRARAALAKALDLNAEFNGAADARAQLATLAKPTTAAR